VAPFERSESGGRESGRTSLVNTVQDMSDQSTTPDDIAAAKGDCVLDATISKDFAHLKVILDEDCDVFDSGSGAEIMQPLRVLHNDTAGSTVRASLCLYVCVCATSSLKYIYTNMTYIRVYINLCAWTEI